MHISSEMRKNTDSSSLFKRFLITNQKKCVYLQRVCLETQDILLNSLKSPQENYIEHNYCYWACTYRAQAVPYTVVVCGEP